MSEAGKPRVLAAAAHGAVDFIASRGGDPERAAALSGLTLEELEDPFHPIDLAGYCRLFEVAANESGHDNLGLWFGQQFQPHQLGLIGAVVLRSATLGEALRDLAAHFPRHQSGTRTRLFVEDGLLHIEYRIIDGRIASRRQDAELTMGMFVNLMRHVLGRAWAPDEVHLEHARPDAAGEHEQAFQAPIYFHRPGNALAFRPARLDTPMPQADAAEKARLLARLKKVSTGAEMGFAARVSGEILGRLAGGEVRAPEIAAALHVSTSTMLRRLEAEGCGFFELVEQARGEQARLYLARDDLPLTDIALLLGYSELSAFSRAFRRWTGMSPTQFRASRGVRPAQV